MFTRVGQKNGNKHKSSQVKLNLERNWYKNDNQLQR